MLRIFGSPHRYIQGPGAFDSLGDVCRPLGTRPALVIDADVLKLVEPRLQAAFAGWNCTILPVRGEITVAVLDVLAGQARDAAVDLVVGVGGGKALDTGKGVSRRLDVRFVSVPTVASNDSPTAMALAVSDDAHTLTGIEYIMRNPEAVIVDTALIAQAPPHFLRAGMGDAVAKKFEAERAVVDGGRNFHDTKPLLTAQIIADGCYRTLRRHGRAAMAAAAAHQVTDDLEAVVEANILMAGLGWESGGLSIAHAVVRGLAKARGANRRPHGEHVAYGLLVQLVVEGRSDVFLEDLSQFYRDVGLPLTLSDLSMPNPEDAEIAEIARLTLAGPKGAKLIVPVDAATITDGIIVVERRGGARI